MFLIVFGFLVFWHKFIHHYT